MMDDLSKLLHADTFDLALFEQIALISVDPSHPMFTTASQFLMNFRSHPTAWLRVPSILEYSHHIHTRRYALSVLEALVNQRWAILPESQQSAVRVFMVRYVMQLSASTESLHTERLILDAANAVVAAIGLHDWPHVWPTFIGDVLDSCKLGEGPCQNAFSILRMFCEVIFECWEGRLTAARQEVLREAILKEFPGIYRLCDAYLAAAAPSEVPKYLITSILPKLFVWTPESSSQAEQSAVIQALIQNHLQPAETRSPTLAALSELFTSSHALSESLITSLFAAAVRTIESAMELAAGGADPLGEPFSRPPPLADAELLLQSVIFLASVFRSHLQLLEQSPCSIQVLRAHLFLIKCTALDDPDFLAIILEFWAAFAESLFEDKTAREAPGAGGGPSPRVLFYQRITPIIREVLICNMAHPEEMLVVVDENGHAVRECMSNTQQLYQYNMMRTTLVYLANLDVNNTYATMLLLLSELKHANLDRRRCNTLCWAIGCIPEVTDEGTEGRFLMSAIRDLITLCNKAASKQDRTIVAANIMHIVGQYPRFLRSHWSFLRTVVRKLFEWMGESHPGVKDMACDTFLKVVKRTARTFVIILDTNTQRTYIDELIDQTDRLAMGLDESQKQTLYAAMATLVDGYRAMIKREELTRKLLASPNATFDRIIANLTNDLSTVRDLPVINTVASFARTNTTVCRAVKAQTFAPQFGRVSQHLLRLYQIYSEDVEGSMRQRQQGGAVDASVKPKFTARCEILELVRTYIRLATSPAAIAQSLLTPIIELVFEYYMGSIPEARDPTVLLLCSTLIKKCGEVMQAEMPTIFESVIDQTIPMITANFVDFPEHRINFYRLLHTVTRFCFPALQNPERLQMAIDVLVWGLRHTVREVSQCALAALMSLLGHVEQRGLCNSFYATNFVPLFREIFVLLLNGAHKVDFAAHCTILSKMLYAVSEVMTTPLDGSGAPDNRTFLCNYLRDMIAEGFPNVAPADAAAFAAQILNAISDKQQFKSLIRDMLVVVHEFSRAGEDNQVLFSEEQSEAARQREAEKQAQRLTVPGLVGPHDPAHPDISNTEPIINQEAQQREQQFLPF